MIERPRRVVLLIDYDNLQICASRDTPGRELQLTPVVQLAQRYGTVILARAYAEWNLSTERLAVYKAGIEPAFAPVLRTESDRSGKSLADTVMVAEGMDMLWTLSPEVVVLATSDKDLIPLVRVAKQRGAFVVVLGSDFTAIPLREMADDHITYRQLITDASGRFATEAGPGRQPAALPEPTRTRRTRDRNGRERTLTPPAAGAPAAARPERESSARPERESSARSEREATPRAEPAARPEREAAPRTEREPATTGSAAAEPVAPVTAGAPGDADGSTGPRRRRRRGSRRRSDRLGVGGEGGTGTESGYGDGAQADDDDDEITPTTSAGDVARASDATIERAIIEPPESGVLGAATGKGTSSADAESGAADVRGAASGSGAGAEASSAAGDAEAGADGGAAAPRTRRRRTSLRTPRAAESAAGTTEASAPTSDQSPAGESSSGPSASGSSAATVSGGTPLPSGASPVPEQSADILPAPPPEGSSTNGPTSDDAEAASTPARRPRRVASASRGRTRRA